MAVRTRRRSDTRLIDWSVAQRTDLWIEAAWLTGIVLLPVLFNFRSWVPGFEEPKGYALHFVGVVTGVLLLWDIATRPDYRGMLYSFDAAKWRGFSLASWLLVGVGVFVFVYIISTLLSPVPELSIWGETVRRGGYDLYSFLSMIVIFIAVVLKLRTRAQLFRLFLAVAVAGTLVSLYGVSQQFGFDPIGYGLGEDSRAYASLGNPINLGGYVVIAAPMTLALALMATRRKRVWYAVVAIALMIQFSALWFTGSRGPFVGVVAGFGLLGLMVLLLRDRGTLLRLAAVMVPALVGTFVIITVPGSAGTGGRTADITGDFTGFDVDTGNTSGVFAGGIQGRLQVWSVIGYLAVSWDKLPEDTGLSKVLRPVFGYGPHMLRFSTTLDDAPRTNISVIDNAHNRNLQILMEQGYVGGGVFAALNVLVAVLGFQTWRLLRRRGDPFMTVVLMFLSAALIGSFVEQLSGVARVTDLMMWWLMAGAMISINLVARKPSAQPAAETPRRRRQPQQSSGILSPGWALTALVATIGAFVLFVTTDLDKFRAGLLGSGLGEVSAAAGSLDTARRAQELSPREEYYYQVEAFALRIQAERRYNQGDVEAARQLALQAYSVYQKYQRINPLAYETRFGAARNLVELIQYGSPEFLDDMGDRYADLAAQFPGEVKVQGIASNALLAAGRVDDALRIANWAIELESTTIPVPGAYIARGRAQLNMGMEDQAAADFAHVIETAEGELVAIAHDELAKVLEMQGRPDEAEEHRRLAEDLRSGAA